MRKFFIILAAVLLTASVFMPQQTSAQAPEKMSYQAIIRNSSSQLVKSQAVGMQISILQGTVNGTVVYVETQTATTNANGLVTIEIGAGTTSDDFTTIDWANGPYFIKTETDPTGETSYSITGTSQLLSVPYALHAKTAESIGDASVPIYTADEIAALNPAEGYAVYNSTDDLYQIYIGSEWKAFNANCWPQPTVANAGTDQILYGSTTVTLAANTPELGHGTGSWSIVSGTGGSFDDAYSPTTTFSGTEGELYVLRWTIITNCSSISDDMSIRFILTLTDADGNTYNTVWIGTQLWMAENLKVTKTVNGNTIPLVTDKTEWANLGDNNIDSAYCYYSNSTDSLAKYGALYTYAAAKDACPSGWHLPTDAEWTELENYISNDHSGTEGTALKATSGWNSSGNGTDNYGFSALPGGFCSISGTFYSVGDYGFWWSATEYSISYASFRRLGYDSSDVTHYYDDKSYGFSVRCVRDN